MLQISLPLVSFEVHPQLYLSGCIASRALVASTYDAGLISRNYSNWMYVYLLWNVGICKSKQPAAMGDALFWQ